MCMTARDDVFPSNVRRTNTADMDNTIQWMLIGHTQEQVVKNVASGFCPNEGCDA
nr:hypothetical protein RKHAN_02775 [Rhizobium sp. Khangiran2]